MEAWVLFDFDPAQVETGIWRGMGGWFEFKIPKKENDLGASFSVLYGLKATGRRTPSGSACYMRVGFSIDGKEVPHPSTIDCTSWGTNKWHHVAVMWKDGRYLTIYVDGKEVDRREYPWSIIRDIPSSAQVVIGFTGYIAKNAVAVDEVRISSVARKPEELGFFCIPLKPDPATLLLENFENVFEKDGRFYTRPEVIGDVSAPAEYQVIGGKIVPGKYGKGFLLHP
ncbi:MAG: LamG domain-containing protein [Candidatus Omnitrophica bacterium]|nr:LamG domain-containing protein [Candidatus Omnitrophota bacterium]MCM8817634.1 LamG domain-containing protein [Candidatus Omnitrophota bacterium]